MIWWDQTSKLSATITLILLRAFLDKGISTKASEYQRIYPISPQEKKKPHLNVKLYCFV